MLNRRDMIAALGLGATGVLGTSAGRAAGAARPRIYMITFRGETEVERGYRDYFAANNVDAEFITRDIDRDIRKLPALVAEIREIKPDLVYTWGTPVTLGVTGRFDAADPSRHIADIPVVFALVAAPVAAGIIPSLERPGRRVTGAIHVVPPEKQLRAMKSYRPFKTLGVLFSRSEQNSVAIVEELRRLAGPMEFRLVERSFAMNAQGAPVADGVEERVAEIRHEGADWLYYLPDTFLGTIYGRVSPAALAAGLPTFGAAELAVREGGALVGLISRYYSVGQLAASKSIDILRGRDPSAIPAETLRRFSLIINMEVAKSLEFYPPLSMLNYAEVI